ncbi:MULTISPECIES: GNAT family N-acetyltransferase [Dyella]|uniref:N-acetyltransferase n=2 Tax=Dyella TaxID=231454 RepID=A0A4R0Z2Q0_9GAMM|nr:MULTISPECIES: GNAT family N-acetyltransferase [Dyella]TBR38943.1 N-acetyltransferase [Dyella terrae]TCI13466.1 N-acetyltransferase [Dyella soli]
MSDAYNIRHEAGHHRFVTVVDGQTCELEYHLDRDVMSITHTGVPDAVGGRGIAAQLVRAALDHARASHWKVIPACSYAQAWMKKHPEYDDLRLA